MRVLVATDAWRPQFNGVVHTYERILEYAEEFGCLLSFVSPADFRTVPCPTYPEIRLALVKPSKLRRMFRDFQPDYIHIATEGPIGLMTRRHCLKAGCRFTTSYHTRFPEYVSSRAPVPISWLYEFERWFHNSGIGMMAATQSLADELKSRGFKTVMPWSRGVDTKFFRPRNVRKFDASGPVFLYVGRVAVEKNIEAFLQLVLPGQKVVVGNGPQLDELRSKFPSVIFTGPKYGEDLAECYSSADVFVFPSKTDTFGNVTLEALSSGVPVAAYPVTGPIDIIKSQDVGILDDDLQRAALKALSLDRAKCRRYAMGFSWKACAAQFVRNILIANGSYAEGRHEWLADIM